LDAAAAETAARLIALREKVFLANYGLAKAAAAHGRPPGFDDRLSAACAGLLDAVDRYVPGERSARFAYFATYWIRYQISRQGQKFGGVVAFPIYQQRMVRKIAQLALDRRQQGLGEATQEEVCAALAVGPDAYFRHRQKPTVVSWQAPAIEGEAETGLDYLLCDPAPAPGAELEGEDLATRINGWLKRSFPPATRVMLAYAHEIGPLPEAAAEYLDHLREIARERLRFVAE
jgi:DNA-directed RNA polymerase sigma subunit (sigma70/sigma32)